MGGYGAFDVLTGGVRQDCDDAEGIEGGRVGKDMMRSSQIGRAPSAQIRHRDLHD